MDANRRDVVTWAGAGLASTGIGGCISDVPGGTGTLAPPDDFERVDEPPYGVDPAPCDPPADERDPLYLCEPMPAESSIGFDQAATGSRVLVNEGIRVDGADEGAEYYATLLREDADRDRMDTRRDGPVADLVAGADFDTDVVLVAQTAWGSGSETPHLKRIDATNGGIHAHGCYRRPCIGTTDYTVRTIVARIERPDRIDSALVSLTVTPDSRVTFAGGEGVVTLDEEW